VQIEAESDAETERIHKSKWVGSFNGPVDLDTFHAREFEKLQRSSIFAGIIDLFDTTPGEAAYWQRKLHQEA
jgi:hypothetical protein